MNKLRKYLNILLTILFITYLGCLIAFTHVHIINGVTIVHSHPYSQNSDGSPQKEHTYAEFQLLHQLSTIQITEGAFTVAFVVAASGLFLRLILTYIPVVFQWFTRGILSLRAPPVGL